MDKWKDLTGQVVNNEFHLVQYLGGSEPSAVFLTERNGQKATIKLIPATSADVEARLSRWGTAQKLSHANLIRLFAADRCEVDKQEFLFVVMEYAEEELSQVLPQRPLTPSELKDMVPQVLSALAYVHSRGLVHSRLKPRNILASGDQLKISSDSLCEIGERGSARRTIYDAPESSGQLSPASDLWSFGVTLVEALTQRLPAWDGRGDPVPPQDMPAPFLGITRDCLSFDPQRRPTIAEILERLQGRPATGKKQMSTGAATRPRSPYVVPVAAAVLVVGVSVGSLRLLHHRAETQPIVAPSELTSEPKPASPNVEHAAVTPAPEQVAQSVEDKPPAASAPLGPKLASFDSQSKPRVSSGELIQGGVLQKILPQVPERARETIHGTVRVAVRLHVDSNGNVVRTKFESAGPSKYFARLAQDAARKWKFDPPSRDGQDQASEWVLRFEFTQRGTKVIPFLSPS
ncbi:MAG TPA: TonB family protein [Terriglobales bacterium]|nr:TonB family protein [Terriglobales bacterium]